MRNITGGLMVLGGIAHLLVAVLIANPNRPIMAGVGLLYTFFGIMVLRGSKIILMVGMGIMVLLGVYATSQINISGYLPWVTLILVGIDVAVLIFGFLTLREMKKV